MIVGLYPLYLFDLCLCATHLVGVMFATTNSTARSVYHKDLFRWTDSFSIAFRSR